MTITWINCVEPLPPVDEVHAKLIAKHLSELDWSKINLNLNTVEILPPRYEIAGTTIKTFIRSREISADGTPGPIKELQTSTLECGTEQQLQRALSTLNRINQ